MALAPTGSDCTGSLTQHFAVMPNKAQRLEEAGGLVAEQKMDGNFNEKPGKLLPQSLVGRFMPKLEQATRNLLSCIFYT